MDDLTQNEIQEYLSGLSKPVLELVQDKTWGKRVDEISVKYSLNDEQSTVLKNLTLFVLVGVESPETFGASLETELGISQILTEQILADLDTRVFQYAFDFISKQNEASGANQSAPETTTATATAPKINSNILYRQTEEVEVPPVILPMVESDEERKKNAEQNRIAGSAPASANVVMSAPTGFAAPKISQAPDNLPGVTIGEATSAAPQSQSSQPQQAPKIPSPPSTASNQTQDGRFVGSEFVQKPIPVPKFNVAAAPENVPSAPQNPIAPADKKPEIQNPPRYVDPYREPIE